jgi:hypothetical protein
MTPLAVAGMVMAVLGLWFGGVGVRRFARLRVLAGMQHGSFALLLLLAGGLLLLLASNLTVYQRLVYETPVATLDFTQTAPLTFEVQLRRDNALDQRYELHGDEWQLDARMLKWHGMANVVGLDAQYRLHRIAGRYANIDQERVASRSIYAIGDDPEVDIWKLASDHEDWFGWLVDAAYGSAVYLPMTDGARYTVSMSQSGLVARPDNDVARRAVSRWIGL